MNLFRNLIFKSGRTAAAIAIMVAAVLTFTVGCSDDNENIDSQYGYVQFKLYKEASFEGGKATRNTKLDLLSDAHKIEVVMQYSGSTITQTLVLNSYNDENAEFGLRSDKLQLMAGDYTLIGFYLYDKLDNKIVSGDAGNANVISVVKGGLTVKELGVDATARGMASFRLVKDIVKTRSEDDKSYPFNSIRVVDITVKNLFTQEETTIKKIKVTHQTDFKEGSADEDLYPGKNAQTSFGACDTVVWLKAGNYSVSRYTTYSDRNGKNLLESKSLGSSNTFVVSDNEIKEDVSVPIQLKESAEYIKDYIALKEIWEALDGKNWRYYGEAAPLGSNWNFNKDIDMWGFQPGVALEANGRVASLNISGFGAKGVVPDAIGQLTELKVLAFGTHDEKLGGHLLSAYHANMSDEELKAIRYSYDSKFLAKDGREGLSDILKDAINRDPSQKAISSNRISLKDVQFGNLTNGIVGISKAMMRLTQLQQFYLANSPITTNNFFRDIKSDSPFYAERNELSWSNLNNLLDIEIYNCPSLGALPIEFLTQVPELQSLNIAANAGISAEQLKSDWIALANGTNGDKIQLLYMGFNNLKEFPEYEHLNKMNKLGLLDCTSNQIEKLHPFGKEVCLVKFYLDNNKISEVPKADDGFFFGFNDIEDFSISGNNLTVFPDIFNAKSRYVMGSVDFSNNKIESFEGGDSFKGINASTVNLSNNRLTTFPAILFKSGSPISSLMLMGNGMTEIPKGAMTGENSFMLSSLPSDFYGTNIPYLYGIDVSYNSFSKFPYAPLDVSSLTVFGIRHQRDGNGNRTLREWPTGIFKHSSLKALYIGSNDLRKIEDTISPYISILEIKDNPNISIDVSSVCPYITAGIYLLIYDKTQDIRGCSALGIEN